MPPQISLRALREHLNLTLEDVAEAMRDQGQSISRSGLNNIELGHRPAAEVVLVAWAKALGVDRWHIKTGPELIQWVSAVQGDAGCRCRAGLPRNRRTTRAAA